MTEPMSERKRYLACTSSYRLQNEESPTLNPSLRTQLLKRRYKKIVGDRSPEALINTIWYTGMDSTSVTYPERVLRVLEHPPQLTDTQTA